MPHDDLYLPSNRHNDKNNLNKKTSLIEKFKVQNYENTAMFTI